VMRLRGRPLHLFWVALGIGGLVVLRVGDPTSPNWLLRCPSLALLGLFCPGCGSQRAIHSLLHGEIGAALAYNPLLVLILALTPLVVWRPRVLQNVTVGRSLVVGMVLFAVARNIPFPPFSILAPGALLTP